MTLLSSDSYVRVKREAILSCIFVDIPTHLSAFKSIHSLIYLNLPPSFKDSSAGCLACLANIGIDAYCAKLPETVGCPKPNPTDQPKPQPPMCCKVLYVETGTMTLS
jgi:hypothetical protein